jgi:hypothetical protein
MHQTKDHRRSGGGLLLESFSSPRRVVKKVQRETRGETQTGETETDDAGQASEGYARMRRRQRENENADT